MYVCQPYIINSCSRVLIPIIVYGNSICFDINARLADTQARLKVTFSRPFRKGVLWSEFFPSFKLFVSIRANHHEVRW